MNDIEMQILKSRVALAKHGDHDQKSHGNRGGGSSDVRSLSELHAEHAKSLRAGHYGYAGEKPGIKGNRTYSRSQEKRVMAVIPKSSYVSVDYVFDKLGGKDITTRQIADVLNDGESLGHFYGREGNRGWKYRAAK